MNKTRFAVLGLFMVSGIVYVYEGQRRIPVQYARRLRGNRWYGGGSTHIPLRVNSAGMIPLIFAQSVLILPGVFAQYFTVSDVDWVRNLATTLAFQFSTQSNFYWLMYFVMVIGFTYMYTNITFQQQNLPETEDVENETEAASDEDTLSALWNR